MCNYLQLFVWGIPSVICICMFHPHSIWKGKYFVLLILSLWSQVMYYCFKVFCFLFFYKSSVANWQCQSLNHGLFAFCFLPLREMKGEICTASCMRSVSNLYCWASPLGFSGRVRATSIWTPETLLPNRQWLLYQLHCSHDLFLFVSIILNPHICNCNVKASLKM